jgi:hypothetical protein
LTAEHIDVRELNRITNRRSPRTATEKDIRMALFAPFVPTLAVAAIYCLWYRVYDFHMQRQRVLRERVAYMLWVAASEAD